MAQPPVGVVDAIAGRVSENPFEIVTYPSNVNVIADQIPDIKDSRPTFRAPGIPVNFKGRCDVVGHPPLSIN